MAFSAPLGVVERDDALDQSADSRRNPTVRSRENGVGVWCVRPIIKIHEQKVLFDWTMALTQNTGLQVLVENVCPSVPEHRKQDNRTLQ